MKITLVRHGQTEFNFNNILQGLSNNQLNDTGRRQCQKLRNQLKDINFSFCYMSPLIRTVETAFILVGDRVETFPDKRLIERDMGNLEGKPRSEYDVKKYWDYKLKSSDLGVEPIQNIFLRCQDFLDYVMKKHANDEHLLIVSHGSLIRVLHHLLHHSNVYGDLLDVDIINCYCETIEVSVDEYSEIDV